MDVAGHGESAFIGISVMTIVSISCISNSATDQVVGCRWWGREVEVKLRGGGCSGERASECVGSRLDAILMPV